MVNVSRSTIQRIMRDNRQHAFHYKRVQNLLPEDYPARINLCTCFLQKCGENPRFVYKVLFTNESYFSRGGTSTRTIIISWRKKTHVQ
ncbi:hypothetical protein BDFB_014746 [Asbolus verrucosus]|uniref:Uncharacterized protein n=1 Tax=Asbolus verrucosus TaxID=1661398 RepID=A0A482VHR3_ASBVE|nr:hypothetical protein BDFB_014746 [Asbolus verrucosus]